MKSLQEIEQDLESVLSKPLDASGLRLLREVLKCDAPMVVDRPWIPNRYAASDMEGIQLIWDRSAEAIGKALSSYDTDLQRLALIMLLYAPSKVSVPYVYLCGA